MRDSKKDSFRNLLLGALVGSLLTGVSQYLINIQSHAQRESERRVVVLNEYLKGKLETRTQAYKEVAQKINEAILNPTLQARQAAIRSLHDDIPFFQPRVESQSMIISTKRLLLSMLTGSDDKLLKMHGPEVYERLKQDFQNDLDSIRQELFSFQSRN